MVSTAAKIYNSVLRLMRARSFLLKSFTNPRRSKKKVVPTYIERAFRIERTEVMNRPVVTLQGKDESSNKHLIFLHGGAYVLGMTPFHWKAAKQIVTKAHCRLSYVDYPLAPENSYKDTFSMLDESYKLLLEKFPEDEFIFMGDSAGGGLALAFIQNLRDENAVSIPQKTVLFSPWLDMVMDNDEIRLMEKTDLLLSIEALHFAAQSYAKGEVLSHPLLSPINGEMHNLGEILVFVGSYELFLPDCRKLKVKIGKTNTKMVLKEYPRMHHDWLIAGIPETKQAIGEICAFIDED